MSVLAALAGHPSYHKFVELNPRHTTILNKNPNLCTPLFDVVESAMIAPAEQMMSEGFVMTAEIETLSFDLGRRRKGTTPGEGDDADDFAMQCCSKIRVAHLSKDKRSLSEIMAQEGGQASLQDKFSLMWHIRMRRLMTTLEGRVQVLKMQYQAILILFLCQSDVSLLHNFFQDKTELLKDFTNLVRTGPGTPGYESSATPLEVRILAIECLAAIVGSRDSSSPSVLGRFSWLQYDLGTTRGQYMGLLPCALRCALTGLCELEPLMPPMLPSSSLPLGGDGEEKSSDRTEASPRGQDSDRVLTLEGQGSMEVATAKESTEGADVEAHTIWAENILLLTLSVVNMTSGALAVLTDNGFVQSMLNVVALKPCLVDRSPARIGIDSLIVQTLETAIGNHSPTLVIFKEHNGPETILERMEHELAIMDHQGHRCSQKCRKNASVRSLIGTYSKALLSYLFARR